MILCLPTSSLPLSYILLHLVLIMFTPSTSASATYGFTNETDKQALLAIKDQIHEDPFKVLSSWNDSTHFCSWQGVTCSLKDQRVTNLNLPSMNLVGSIPPHIGNLTFLRTVRLENNGFRGTVPQELGQLNRLQHLSLNTNSFEGVFPANLGQCSAIRVINMSHNRLAGSIPAQLGSLSILEELDLSYNNFIGKIPPSLGNLSALHFLLLQHNNLEGSIPFELGQLSNLQNLSLAFNNLSGIVPAPLFNISSLTSFAVTSNFLEGRLPPTLGLTLPNLKVFLLSNNSFSGPIPPSVANASGLVLFVVAYNYLTGPVPMNLGSLRDLEKLNLAVNKIGTEQPNDLSFFDSLTNCKKLRIISLSVNDFSGVLPNSIANLSTHLMKLMIFGNQISGSIPHVIGNLINLMKLSLEENKLTGSIPESIGKLTILQEMYINQNHISGKIPSSIGNLYQLSTLNLSGNMLEGSIPVALGNCTALQELHLSYNHLVGAIPEHVIGISSLTIGLYLQGNNFTGPLPPQVGNLKNLGLLDVSGNNLSGEIPSSLGDCLVLESLYLDGNLFEGTIPASFKQLRGIQVLDLSHNNLSGEIPSFLGEFQLQHLNLSYNRFEGEVPDKGVFRNASAVSIAGNMKLCGGTMSSQLPACPAKASRRHKKSYSHRVIIIIASITVSVILLIACVSIILYQIRRSKKKSSLDYQLGDPYPTLSYAELLQATNGFSSANLIGEGRYGSVYKGILNPSEQVIAVKVLKLDLHGANKSFLAECEALRCIRHRNLVKVVTSCSSIDFKGNDFKALVFEFMKNGSLESWLHPTSSWEQNPNSFVQLKLIQRLNIAIDVASALDYLHCHCETAIIHCDIKPSNVLLDDEFRGHLGDFGLAKFLNATTGSSDLIQSSSSIAIRGTTGFVAPEYAMGLEVSKEGDVYSYGIVLLEMFTGKRPSDNMFADNFSLHNYVKMALPERVMEIADSFLAEEEEENVSERTRQLNIRRVKECLVSVLQIGINCSTQQARERMEIKDVLVELHRIRNAFVGDRRERVRQNIQRNGP